LSNLPKSISKIFTRHSITYSTKSKKRRF